MSENTPSPTNLPQTILRTSAAVEDIQTSRMDGVNVPVTRATVQPTDATPLHIPFQSDLIGYIPTISPTSSDANANVLPSIFRDLVPTVGPNARNAPLNSSSSGAIGGVIGGVALVLIVCIGLVVVLWWRRRTKKYVFESKNPVGNNTLAFEGKSINIVILSLATDIAIHSWKEDIWFLFHICMGISMCQSLATIYNCTLNVTGCSS